MITENELRLPVAPSPLAEINRSEDVNQRPEKLLRSRDQVIPGPENDFAPLAALIQPPNQELNAPAQKKDVHLPENDPPTPEKELPAPEMEPLARDIQAPIGQNHAPKPEFQSFSGQNAENGSFCQSGADDFEAHCNDESIWTAICSGSNIDS